METNDKYLNLDPRDDIYSHEREDEDALTPEELQEKADVARELQNDMEVDAYLESKNPLDGVNVEMQPKGIAKNIMDAVLYGKKL